MELKPGQIWKHYKGADYRIVVLGRSSETDDTYDVVVYENIAEGKIWVQSKNRFLSNEEYQGETVARFTFVSDN
mgnify:CR=1 FL=1